MGAQAATITHGNKVKYISTVVFTSKLYIYTYVIVTH